MPYHRKTTTFAAQQKITLRNESSHQTECKPSCFFFFFAPYEIVLNRMQSKTIHTYGEPTGILLLSNDILQVAPERVWKCIKFVWNLIKGTLVAHYTLRKDCFNTCVVFFSITDGFLNECINLAEQNILLQTLKSMNYHFGIQKVIVFPLTKKNIQKQIKFNYENS